LRSLPPRVAWFQWRAHRLAMRSGDQFSLISATRPKDLAILLELARGRRRIVELGTGTAWTAAALALADPAREVTSFDPIRRPETVGYLELVRPDVRRRIRLITADGALGPQDQKPIDMLYVDSSHDRQQTIAELAAWRPVIVASGLIVLDDYTHADYDGVREAVSELALPGVQSGTMFVHRVEHAGQ
jgi:predicted O-methyltransferase YrrM